MPRGAVPPQWGRVAEERPLAVVERDESGRQVGAGALGEFWAGQVRVFVLKKGSLVGWRGGCLHPPVPSPAPLPAPSALQLRFSLVHRLAKPSSRAGAMWVGELTEGADGLFRCGSGSVLSSLLFTCTPTSRCNYSDDLSVSFIIR